MRGDVFLKVRGREVLVKFDVDFSGPGSGCGVEWWFDDGRIRITSAEEDWIVQRCIEAAEELQQREP